MKYPVSPEAGSFPLAPPGDLVNARESKTWETRESLVDSWVSKLPWRRDRLPTPVFSGFPGASDSKRTCLQCRRPEFGPCVGRIPWRRAWQTTPVFLPGECHGQRSLADYSPWGDKESDTTEQLSIAQMYIYITYTHIYKTEKWHYLWQKIFEWQHIFIRNHWGQSTFRCWKKRTATMYVEKNC